ncbi:MULTISPECIES: hypothetical protein [Streptomyces]|uniref:hypothetical protein n=1 Tax=Streptomyces TaxID=1883 RepID=UPI003723596E
MYVLIVPASVPFVLLATVMGLCVDGLVEQALKLLVGGLRVAAGVGGERAPT